jgi:hypothetical protein
MSAEAAPLMLVQNQMMADVLAHLRAISGQQSKIRGLRSKLAILKEAAAKQEGATSELLLVRRIPAVYRQCLAECMRRCGRYFTSHLGPPTTGAYVFIKRHLHVEGRHTGSNCTSLLFQDHFSG